MENYYSIQWKAEFIFNTSIKINNTHHGGYDGRKDKNMKFVWWTRDGKMHEKFVIEYEDRLNFIEWLETSPDVVSWQ